MVGGNKAQLKATALTLHRRIPRVNKVDKYQITRVMRDKIYADIQRIRQMWCKGSSDMEIRRDLFLSHQQWRARINIMRSTPPDEGVIASFKRYQHQHGRFTLRLESRLNKLTLLYEAAVEDISVVSGSGGGTEKSVKRDPREARRLQTQMARVDEALRSGEEQLLAIKTQLGVIVPLTAGEDAQDINQSLFRTHNVKEVWRRRREKEKEIEVKASKIKAKKEA